MKIHDEKLDSGKIRLVSLVSFFMGFSQAFFIYIMSSYFKAASGIENVGGFYLAAYAVTLICILNLHKVIKRFGKSDVFYFSLFLKILTIVFLLLIPPSWIAILLVVFYIIFGNLEWVSLDIILESCSKDCMSGRIRGKFLTIMNAGILLGPLLSVLILGRYDFYGIFLLLLVFNVFIFFIAIFSFKNVNHRFEKKLAVKDIAKKVIARKDIRNIFYISFVLDFFYALMLIYVPIYLADLGFSWDKIGIIFTAMLVPFVILQYLVGILADKKMGEKELLISSILIMGLSTLAIYFISSGTVLIWSVILFLTRIGAALIEILRDSYFYKRIDGRDVDLIDFFRTSNSLAYISASVFSIVIIFFFSIKAVFILAGLVVISALYSTIKLADNKSEKEISQ